MSPPCLSFLAQSVCCGLKWGKFEFTLEAKVLIGVLYRVLSEALCALPMPFVHPVQTLSFCLYFSLFYSEIQNLNHVFIGYNVLCLFFLPVWLIVVGMKRQADADLPVNPGIVYGFSRAHTLVIVAWHGHVYILTL